MSYADQLRQAVGGAGGGPAPADTPVPDLAAVALVEMLERLVEAVERMGAEEVDFLARLLTAVIAEYDRLTGRTEHHQFSAEDWERVRRVALGDA